MDIADDTVTRSRVGQSLFFKKSDSLFVALFKRAKEQFSICCCFGKEQKSKLLFVALFVKRERANRSLSRFLKEQPRKIALCCSFLKNERAICSLSKERLSKLLF